MSDDVVPAPTSAALGPAFAEQAARATALRSLSDEQLRWRPPGGGWSVGQVLEHLVLTHEPYLARLRTALEDGVARAAAGRVRPWKPTLLGGWVTRSMAAPRKVKARPKFDPGPDVDPGAADRFLEIVHTIDHLVQSADGIDLRVRFTSPVMPIVRPNLGDAFQLLAVHGNRHLDQIDRVMAEPGFPSAGVAAT
jgi:hypothetical protein